LKSVNERISNFKGLYLYIEDMIKFLYLEES